MEVNKFLKESSFDNSYYVGLYKRRMDAFNKIHDALEEKTKDKIIYDGEGDLASPLIIVLKDQSQKDILPFYKEILEAYKLGLNNIYVTYLNKCSDMNLNLSAFKSEVTQIGPTGFFILNGFDCDLIPQDYKAVADYDKIKTLMSGEITAEEKEELQKTIWKSIYVGFNFLLKNIVVCR